MKTRITDPEIDNKAKSLQKIIAIFVARYYHAAVATKTVNLSWRQDLAIDRPTLRKLTLQAFGDRPRTQWESLKKDVAQLADQRGLIASGTTATGMRLLNTSGPNLPVEDSVNLHEIVWDLIVERVLNPGDGRYAEEWPWLHITEQGKIKAAEELESASP